MSEFLTQFYGGVQGNSFKLTNATNSNIYDNGVDDIYANIRVIRNVSTTNQDGLYIGYANSLSSGNRIFDGSSVNFLYLAGATLSTIGFTKFLFGNENDTTTFAQFSGNVRVKSNLSVDGITNLGGSVLFGTTVLFNNNMYQYWVDRDGASQKMLGMDINANFNIGDSQNFMGYGSNKYFAFSNHIFSTNGVERMRINSSGYVGIGTPAPLFALHTIGTIKSDRVLIGSNSDNGSALQITGNVTISNEIIATSYRLPLSTTPFIYDAGISNFYANMRVIRNISSNMTDGMYIGYGNSGAGATRVFDGGGTNALILSAGNLTTDGFTKLFFGTQTDSGTFAQFAGAVHVKSNLIVDGITTVQGLTIGKGAGSIVTNTVFGQNSLISNTTGGNNTMIGYESGKGNINGSLNTSLGANSLKSITNGSSNIAIGARALLSGTSVFESVAIGQGALQYNLTGYRNTAVGHITLLSANGNYNTAIGAGAGNFVTTGNNNIFIGADAGSSIMTGSYNTIIGGSGVLGDVSNNIVISDGAGNSRINVNEIGNVGIGTSTPATNLEVRGGIRISGNGSRLTLPNNVFNQWNIDNSSGTLRFFREDYSVTGFGANGDVKMVILDNGYVGIGSRYPTMPLDVIGGINTNLFYYIGGTLFASNTGNGSNTINARVVANNNSTGAGADGMYIGYGNTGVSPTRIFDGGTANYLTIGSTGLTTTGLTKFMFGNQTDDGNFAQFAGSVKAKGNLRTNSNLVMEVNNTWINMTDNASINRRMMGIAPDNTFYVGDIDNTISTGNNVYATYGFHSFKNYNNESVRITQGGFVGIGTNNPATRLQVNGYGQPYGITLGDRPDTSGAVFTSIYLTNTGNGILNIQTNRASTGFGVTAIQPNGGNVGIGTSAPLFALHTIGTIKSDRVFIGSNSDNGNTFQVTGTASVSSVLSLGDNIVMNNGQSQNWKDSTGNSKRMVGLYANNMVFGDLDNSLEGSRNWYYAKTLHTFMTNGVERVTITALGSVGIGTTSPMVQLDVVGGIRSSSLTGTVVQMVVADTNGILGTQPIFSGLPLSGGTLTGNAGTGFIGFTAQYVTPVTPFLGFNLFANASNALSWKGVNGFVRTLDGTANTADRSYILPDASGTLSLLESTQIWTGVNTFNGNNTIGGTSGNITVIGNATNSATTILSGTGIINIGNEASSTGSIGIGNTSSGQRTVVLGSSNASSQVIIQGGSGGGTYFKSGTTEVMRINNGYIGIKNLSPTFELDVVGTSRSTRFLTGTLNPASTSSVTNPIRLYIPSFTNTDTSTVASGTVAHTTNTVFGVPTFGSTNINVTNTTASNLYIAGSPIAGTNTTITNPFALFVNSGNSYFGGNVGIGTTSPLGILDVSSITTPSYPFPRMTTVQVNAIVGMTAGAFVYDTTANRPKFYNGTSWIQL